MDITTSTFRRGTGLALVAAALALTPAAALAQQPTRPQPVLPVAQPAGEQDPDPGPQPGQATIAAPPAAGPPALGPDDIETKVADAAKLGKEIDARLDGAFGWQWAIAQGGKFVAADGLGTARSATDNGGVSLAMEPTMRWELASLTKNVTAAATLKLLRMHGETVESSVDEWLPADWKRGAGFDTKSVTFRHLLTHTSGINQMLVALPEGVAAANAPNTWAGAKWVVGQGTQPNSGRSYKNMNYVLLSVLNAQMWHAINGDLPGNPPVPVSATSYGNYGMHFFNQQLFGPIGIHRVSCVGSAATAGLNYPAGATQQSKGGLSAWPAVNCASNAGLRLSSVEVVKWLAHLRFGTVMHADDVATMEALDAGWYSGAYGGGHRHGGDFDGARELNTCGSTFPDGTAVALIVNSALPAGADYQCDIVLKAWQAAMP